MFYYFGPLFFFVPLLFVILGVRLLSRFFHWSRRDDQRNIPPRDEYLRRYIPDVLGEEFVAQRGGTREVEIFKLAYRLKGRLTVSDLVVETGLPVQEAEALIQALVDGTRVKMEVNEHGMVVYEFPEIIARFETEK